MAYILKRHRPLLFTGAIAVSAITAWIAFLVTGWAEDNLSQEVLNSDAANA